MGRRALRKIDLRLDLTGYLNTAEQLPETWTSGTLFGSAAPLEIEVGSGKGLFLAAASTACPQVNYLGVEVARKYARFAAARLARAGCANAKIVQGEAVGLLQQHVPAESVQAIHVYFPDPWWKLRHHKRRIMRQEFVQDIHRMLVPGGALHFWTDVAEYFQQSVALISTQTGLDGPFTVGQRPAEHDLDYRTHFERRTRLHDQEVYRALFRKAGVETAACTAQPEA